jgi:hypothetical protein
VENRAEYRWAVERNGVTILVEEDFSGIKHYLCEIPKPPFMFHALPKTGGQAFFVKIDEGEEYIWLHRVRDSVNIYNGDRHVEDCLIFGKRHSDGKEAVLLVYPNGSHFEFSSLPQALAHTL